jgi:hypothetical protein
MTIFQLANKINDTVGYAYIFVTQKGTDWELDIGDQPITLYSESEAIALLQKIYTEIINSSNY